MGYKGTKYRSTICICKQCNTEFYEYNSRILLGRGIFCSMKCRDILKTESAEFAENVKLGVLKKYSEDKDYKRRVSVGTKKAMKNIVLPQYNPNLTAEDRRECKWNKNYVEWRTQVYERDRYTCRRCFHLRGNLNAHHILNWSSNKEFRYDVANGMTLCRKCHLKFHAIYGTKNNTLNQLTDFVNSVKGIQ